MRVALAVTVLFAAAFFFFACGTDPVGVESCKRIEHARCENAPACGIDLGTPVHRGDTPELAVVACERFYDDACLHGFAAPNDPGDPAVQQCIDAINTSDCSVVKTPEIHPACSFLIPPASAPADAGDDG